MLGFRWFATEAGAPDDTRYPSASDRLADVNRNLLQDLPKSLSGVPSPSPEVRAYVENWLNGRSIRQIVVMVHGFDYDVSAVRQGTGKPTAPADDPFNLVYALPGRELTPIKPQSWLPIVGETDDLGTLLEDCAIGFGWDSDNSFFGAHACLSNGYQFTALDVAPLAARALATLLRALENKGLEISLFAHSLGTRVACQALRQLSETNLTHLVHRVLLLEGAEYSIDAYDAVRKFPGTDFYNIGNQDDDWPPRGGMASHPFRQNGTPQVRVIAYDGIADLPNLVDLQIDRGIVQTWASQQGYQLSSEPFTSPDGTRGEHWAGYIHAGNRLFLRDLLTRPDRSAAWFRDKHAPLGFSRHAYGEIGDWEIPAMPQECDTRRQLLHHT